METWKRSVLGVAVGSAVLAGSIAAPALAATVASASNGTIISRGVAVTGTYTADCDFAGQNISTALNVYQNVKGGTINEVWTYDNFTCSSDGLETRTYTAYSDGIAFKAGHATLRVGMFYSDESGNFTGAEDIKWFDIRLGNR